MKRGMSLVLALVLCLSLCACSKECDCGCAYCCGENVKNIIETSVLPSQEPEEGITNPDRIEFSEPVLLAEDEKVSIELVDFFQEDTNSNEGAVKDKYISLRFHNKADYEIGIFLENLSIAEEVVDITYRKAQNPELLPGESLTYFFKIHDVFGNPLDSMEDLYEFKGRFEISRRTKPGYYEDSYEIPFSVETALSGVVGQPSKAETEPAKDDTQGVFTMSFAEPVLLAEDKNLKLEVIDFYQDTWEPTNQPSYTRAHITIRFHNKAGYEMLISPEDFYIGNERVTCVQSDGTPRLLSGKSGNYSFHIKYDSDEPLSSLEELYQLNGRFEVFRYEGDTLYDGYYFPFSVSEAFS